MRYVFIAILMVIGPLGAYAVQDQTSIEPTLGIVTFFGDAIEWLVDVLSAVLFFKIAGFPFLVIWLVVGGVFFSLRLSFVNLRLFKHAIDVVRGKYGSKDDPGEVTHFQSLSAAVSGTVGLGNIAGVAIAVLLGGPGAVIWMMIAAFVGMSAKFAEVTLGHHYRHIDENGKVSGGAFHYLEEGLAEANLPKLGKILASAFAVCCILGALGGGNMFQSSNAVSLVTNTFPAVGSADWAIALVLAISVGTVLIGGIKRIAIVAEMLVPFMAVLYVTAALVVIIVNIDGLFAAIETMFASAFNFEAAGGGAVGAIINGFKRAAFSNEAGLGSAPIAHAAAKTKEPVSEGCVALLEPFIDTIVICFLTGILVTITGVYVDVADGTSGIVMTSNAFTTVIGGFEYVLSVAVLLFAFTTMITWSYYGERCWEYLFGSKRVKIYYIIFCFATFIGGALDNIALVVDLSDLFMLAMAIPNLIGLYILSGKVKSMMDDYTQRLKSNKLVTRD